MGKAIELLAPKIGHTIEGIIDIHNIPEIKNSKADVAIEFSKPEAAFQNLSLCLQSGLPTVCGTTGWLHRKQEIETLCEQQKGSFFYSSNFSLGVNILFALNKKLASMIKDFPTYDVSIDEIHHTQKKDAPSGTAITLAEGIIENVAWKKKWVNHKAEEHDAISIYSHRIESTPGTHTVRYSSPIDDIEIKHTAHSREGFARGALAVAEWLVREQKKGLLNMSDFLKF